MGLRCSSQPGFQTSFSRHVFLNPRQFTDVLSKVQPSQACSQQCSTRAQRRSPAPNANLCLSFISLYHYGDAINMQRSSRRWLSPLLEMLPHVLPTEYYPLIIHMPEEWLPMSAQLLHRVPASLAFPLRFPSHIHTLPLHAKPVFYSLCSCCSPSW